jgi:hypothetical protein
MMGLTEHLIDLLLRPAERLERLPEVNVHEILEQSFVHANCTGEQFIREHVQLDWFVVEQNLGENLRGDVLVCLRVQHADIVPLDDQLMNLLQAEVLAASAVIVAPVPVFSDFQCSRFVAIAFRHGVSLPKNDPPSMLGIPQSSADPPFLSKAFNAIAKRSGSAGMGFVIGIHEPSKDPGKNLKFLDMSQLLIFPS